MNTAFYFHCKDRFQAAHLVWIGGRYAAALLNEFEHILSAGSETAACELNIGPQKQSWS